MRKFVVLMTALLVFSLFVFSQSKVSASTNPLRPGSCMGSFTWNGTSCLNQNGDVVLQKKQASGDCITNWVWNGNEWVKGDFVPSALKSNSSNPNYKVVPGKYCYADPKLKPTSPPSENVKITENKTTENNTLNPVDNNNSVVKTPQKTGFWNWLKGLFGIK